jgi:hypothetical protein
MSRLTDIIQESIAFVEVPGRAIQTHAAAQYGVSKILLDEALTYGAVLEWFTGKIQAAIKRNTKRSGLASPLDYVMAHREGVGGAADITMMVPRQGDLFIDPFGLNDGYLCEGGTGEMHRTRYSNMLDFEGFIRIRDKQIAADTRHANRMRVTLERLRPDWSNDPMMTYEEACALYVRKHGMPPRPDDEGDD